MASYAQETQVFMSTILLFNKPFQVLSQFKINDDRQTLKHYLNEFHGFHPAGRLDYDSEGLLILTDDGALQHRISHPNHKQAKTYWAQVDGDISDTAIKQLQKGIVLNDGPCRPAQVKKIPTPTLEERSPPVRYRKNIPTSWIELRITEGRNRQVRRMTAAVGFPTLRLIRTKIGDWSLDGLASGEHKLLRVHAPTTPSKSSNKRQRRPR